MHQAQTHRGVVTAVSPKELAVRIEGLKGNSEACSGCAASALCVKGGEGMLIRVPRLPEYEGISRGDEVMAYPARKLRKVASWLMFGLPVVLLIAGMWIATEMKASDFFVAFTGLVCAAAAFGVNSLFAAQLRKSNSYAWKIEKIQAPVT